MINFWDSNVWSLILLVGALFLSMIIAHMLKKNISFLNKSLIPASVLGGLIVLVISTFYRVIFKESLFNIEMFSITKPIIDVDGKTVKDVTVTGNAILEIITYHCLAVGFICMGLRSSKKNKDKKRAIEIINTGVTTVSTYLIQVIFGLIITIIAANFVKGLIPASGVILALGYGQGTGQALNYGNIYSEYGLVNGSQFGLAVAALGFLSASLGGVICLNVLKRKGKIFSNNAEENEKLDINHYQGNNEIPVNSSIDKLTIQLAIVVGVYMVAYLVMYLLGNVVGGLKSTVYGFNFLFGTLIAVLFKIILNFLKKKNIVKKEYINDFMMNRIGGVAFDIMIVAGIAAIDLNNIIDYWYVLLIMGVVGAIITYVYVMFVSKKLFKNYCYQQFFAMYGMLTGTASTGVILLREIDPNFETPASDNLVYQNLPAIILGFPILLLANYAPKSEMATYIVLGIVTVLFVILNIFLFRSYIFKKKNKK